MKEQAVKVCAKARIGRKVHRFSADLLPVEIGIPLEALRILQEDAPIRQKNSQKLIGIRQATT